MKFHFDKACAAMPADLDYEVDVYSPFPKRPLIKMALVLFFKPPPTVVRVSHLFHYGDCHAQL